MTVCHLLRHLSGEVLLAEPAITHWSPLTTLITVKTAIMSDRREDRKEEEGEGGNGLIRYICNHIGNSE